MHTGISLYSIDLFQDNMIHIKIYLQVSNLLTYAKTKHETYFRHLHMYAIESWKKEHYFFHQN